MHFMDSSNAMQRVYCGCRRTYLFPWRIDAISNSCDSFFQCRKLHTSERVPIQTMFEHICCTRHFSFAPPPPPPTHVSCNQGNRTLSCLPATICLVTALPFLMRGCSLPTSASRACLRFLMSAFFCATRALSFRDGTVDASWYTKAFFSTI